MYELSVRRLKQVELTMAMARLSNQELYELLTLSSAISALIVAIQMINVFTKKLKYTRRVYLITNATGDIDTDGLEGIADKIKEDNMELIVL